MLLSFLWQRVAVIFTILSLFLFPSVSSAFEISPSIVDVSFSDNAEGVTQLFSIVNTEDVPMMYDAEIRLVVFSEDGGIQDLLEVPALLESRVFPASIEVSPRVEQMFTVTFGAPSQVASDQVFALVLRERGSDNSQIMEGFIALIFPENVKGDFVSSFRVDTFTIGSSQGELQAVAQFTNTGLTLVKPVSIIVAQDFLGREISRLTFAEHEGRLPVGTTRVVTDILPHDDFGFWHIGGPVLFTLLSIADGGGEVQQAFVELNTIPGKGTIAVVGCVVLLFVGGTIFLLKRRGILRA